MLCGLLAKRSRSSAKYRSSRNVVLCNPCFVCLVWRSIWPSGLGERIAFVTEYIVLLQYSQQSCWLAPFQHPTRMCCFSFRRKAHLNFQLRWANKANKWVVSRQFKQRDYRAVQVSYTTVSLLYFVNKITPINLEHLLQLSKPRIYYYCYRGTWNGESSCYFPLICSWH